MWHSTAGLRSRVCSGSLIAKTMLSVVDANSANSDVKVIEEGDSHLVEASELDDGVQQRRMQKRPEALGHRRREEHLVDTSCG